MTVADQDVLTLICRVSHNSSELSTFFYLNGTRLQTSNQFLVDRTIRVVEYNDCHQSLSQEKCQEVILVVRINPHLSGTTFQCRSRPRSGGNMRQNRSNEVRVVVKDSGKALKMFSALLQCCGFLRVTG